MELQAHPAAELFPLLDPYGQEFIGLVEDIRAHGLIDPITLHEGKILDGRNRYRACREAGVPIRTVQYTGDSPVAWVLSKNLHRRQLTDDQKAMVAVAALPGLEAEAEQRRRAAISAARTTETVLNSTPSQSLGSGASRKAAAEAVGVSTDRVRRAKEVAVADPELAKEVATGTTTLREAEKRVRKVRRPELNPAVFVPGQTVKPPRPPREDPALIDRLYKTVNSFPDNEGPEAVAREVQAANLNLPEDAIRKLLRHLARTNSGRLALDRGLRTLLAYRGNPTP